MGEVLRTALCREEDIAALQRFIETHWMPGHILARDEALLRWQYDPRRFDPQRRGGATVMLAWSGDQIIGMLSLTVFEFSAGGMVVPACWMSNWYVMPEHRRRGVAVKLLWSISGLGFQVMGGVGANDKTAAVLGSSGFEVIEDLPRWVAVLDAEQAAGLIADGAGGGARTLAARHLVAPAPAVSDDGFVAVPWSPEAAESWDDHWSRRVAPSVVGARRDARYLSWRYAEHPRFAYTLRVARDEAGGAEGLAVYRVERVRDRQERVLRVLEFITTPAAAPCLARAVVDDARAAGAALADFYCSSACAARGLEAAGFQRLPHNGGVPGFPSRFQPLERAHFRMTAAIRLPQGMQGSLGALLEAGRFYLTKSDGDMDRPN